MLKNYTNFIPFSMINILNITYKTIKNYQRKLLSRQMRLRRYVKYDFIYMQYMKLNVKIKNENTNSTTPTTIINKEPSTLKFSTQSLFLKMSYKFINVQYCLLKFFILLLLTLIFKFISFLSLLSFIRFCSISYNSLASMINCLFNFMMQFLQYT